MAYKDVTFFERNLTLGRACRVAAAGIDVVALLCDPSLETALDVYGRTHPVTLQLLCHELPERLRTIESQMADVTSTRSASSITRDVV